ncbi:response regulator [Cyanobacterium sp. DS4]|uniref:response regulator n=1 Tax=Cyanobacterium sp. DS4 TaxID=2878255 RepID=UPI002E82222B|nr:response regulator [Cyanobacterium sp. Dongsha4]WVL01225.1 response regulator [Cyanobacterium sp. Dongsha4]
MDKNKYLAIEEVIKQQFYLKYNRVLTSTEEVILQGAIENLPYEQIANKLYMSSGTVRNIASKFWSQLSELYNQKITKVNCKYVIENILKSEKNSEKEQLYCIEIDNENNHHPQGIVMIIDDYIENLKFLKQLLEKEGYHVRSARSAKMAFLSLEESLPDLILLDILMPSINGYEICKIIKADTKTSHIPIIFISALNDTIDKIKGFQLGACDYITKPFEEIEVLLRVSHHINLKNQTIRLEEEIKQHEKTIEMLYQSRSILASVLNNSCCGIAVLEAIRSSENAHIIDFKYYLVNPIFATLFNIKKPNIITLISSLKECVFCQLEWIEEFIKVVKTNIDFRDTFLFQGKKYQMNVNKLGDGITINIIPLI